MRNPKTIILIDRDQVAIEKPMNRSGKGDSILDDIRTAIGDGPNMRRLNLRTAATVNDFYAGDGARVFIGGAYSAPKIRVSDLAVEQDLFDAALLLGEWGFQEFTRLRI